SFFCHAAPTAGIFSLSLHVALPISRGALMGSMLIVLVFLGLIVAFVLWGVGIYNGLVTARNAFRNAFAQIDVQLQRRFDLIPNLDRKSTRLNSSHVKISYAVFCLKK